MPNWGGKAAPPAWRPKEDKPMYIENVHQLMLPFPFPVIAELWPNRLGFDLYGLEFWSQGVRNLDTMTYGVGDNWVGALADYLRDPKPCD